MEKILKLFEQWCNANNWIIERKVTPATLPEKVTQRYPLASKSDHFKFLSYFEKCLSENMQSWFLCENEYNKESTETEFGWNDMELMGLAATADDDEEHESIKNWWDNYIPILFSTRDGYSHFSMSLQESSFGQIVEGYEPMFEDVLVVADSLSELLEKIMSKEIVF